MKRRKLKRQRLKLKVMNELKSMNNKKLQNSLYNGVIGVENNIQKLPNRRIFTGGLSGDLSLSRKDFLSELTKWFRRSIWFLLFAGAYTTSPPLILVAVSL